MATVKGKWTFKDALTPPSFNAEPVNFTTSNNSSYIGIAYNSEAFGGLLSYISYSSEDDLELYDDAYFFVGSAEDEYEAGWQDESMKTIDFGVNELEVSPGFYAWLVENAVQADSNIKIGVTANGTITLATAGKYCDRNIDVNVNIPDADELAQGTISGEYVSDKITSLRYFAFAQCSNLISVSLPNCISIDERSFWNCANVESIDLPMCVSINGINAFDSATKLKTINLPNLTTITNANRTFLSCISLEEFNAPNLISMVDTNRLFGVCRALKKVVFPKLGGVTINAYTFYNCTNLETLVLGGDTFNPLENVNAFSGTPIERGTGYIYVRNVDTYRQETNWADYASQIAPYVLTVAELENIDGITYPRCWVDETYSAYTYDGTKWTEVA